MSIGEDDIEATPEHPFWIVQGIHLEERGLNLSPPTSGACGAWVPAGKLCEGDIAVTASGAKASVKTVIVGVGSRHVYNIEVQGAHTYFVGTSELLVHNICKWLETTRTKTIIYKVVDKDTGETIYVGQVNASKGLDARYEEHLEHPKRSNWKGTTEIRKIKQGDWTPFKAHAHEMKEIMNEGGMDALENVVCPIKPNKFEAYKSRHSRYPKDPFKAN